MYVLDYVEVVEIKTNIVSTSDGAPNTWRGFSLPSPTIFHSGILWGAYNIPEASLPEGCYCYTFMKTTLNTELHHTEKK